MDWFLPIVLVGLTAGAAIGLQGPMASMISQRLGILESVFIVHLGGVLVVLVPLLLMGGGQLRNWRSLPAFTLGAGVFGLVVIAAISYLIPRIGVASAFILLVVGQVLVGALLDHFGLLGSTVRSLDWIRAGGFLLAFLGVWLVVR